MNIWTKAGLIILVFIALIGGISYLSSGIFLFLIDEDYNTATPFTLYDYWFHYGDDDYVYDKLLIALGTAISIVIIPFFALLIPNKRSLFGDADFATKQEINKSGLLKGNGIIVGRYNGKFLTLAGQQHILLSAPTRSGKGVGIVIPNLLAWNDSVVVLDIKQENWYITSKFRELHGQKCFLFSPLAADYKTHKYNPLGYISEDPIFRIDDVQKIGNMLFPDKQGTDVIWTATPRTLFLGITLFIIETGKPVTLGQVLRETLNKGDGSRYFKEEIKRLKEEGTPLSGACIRGLSSYTSISSENTRAGVMTGFRSHLELWMNPMVDAATSENDFDLRNLRKDKISIYIGITPDNLDRVAPVINLFFQQLIDLNTRELPSQNKEIKHNCLLLMDEFTAIGKIPILSKGISYIAGYGLRMMPIIQSPAQLVDVYGKESAQTFTTNHALNIIFPPKASETQSAKDISEWLGYQTVKGYSVSKQKNTFNNRSSSESISDQRRALLLPQEITSLGADKEIVVMENIPPILANKIRYYEDPVFLTRLKRAAPSLKDLPIKKVGQNIEKAVSSGELASFIPRLDIEAYFSGLEDHAHIIIEDDEESIETEVTAQDIPTIRSKKLSDFSIDFTTPTPPNGGDMTEEELLSYADQISIDAGLYIIEEGI